MPVGPRAHVVRYDSNPDANIGDPAFSFHPGAVGLDGILGPAREEFFRAFPQIRSDASVYGPATRTCLKRREARALLAA